MNGKTEHPHGTPPGQDKDSPGLGKEDAPGQNKPKPDNELPEEPEAEPKDAG